MSRVWFDTYLFALSFVKIHEKVHNVRCLFCTFCLVAELSGSICALRHTSVARNLKSSFLLSALHKLLQITSF